MKISIITVTYNSAATLKDTLESVKAQDYGDIEHILVDGASKDDTVDIIRSYPHVAKYVSEKDKGLYDAINKGILMSTGDVVGILNSDDFFPHPRVVSGIAECFRKHNPDAIYGDIAFVNPGNLSRIVRFYSSAKFHPRRFALGYMPAHPSFYVKRSCYMEYGLYKTGYRIAADFELLIRFLYKKGIKSVYHPQTMVYMRTGGVSNKNIMSRYVLNKEILRACRENELKTNMITLLSRYFFKITEYITPLFKKKDLHT